MSNYCFALFQACQTWLAKAEVTCLYLAHHAPDLTPLGRPQYQTFGRGGAGACGIQEGAAAD